MESGAYEIQIGENAQDIVLSSRVTVNSVTDIPKVYTRNSTIGEILADTNGKEIFQKTMAQMLGDNAQLPHREFGRSGEGGIGTSVSEKADRTALKSIRSFVENAPMTFSQTAIAGYRLSVASLISCMIRNA
mgnify:CR=1 FL=1